MIIKVIVIVLLIIIAIIFCAGISALIALLFIATGGDPCTYIKNEENTNIHNNQK